MNNQNGAIAILTAIMLTMFLGFAVLSIDTGNLMVARNELQNAADAGALAGANALFDPTGTTIETGCNQIAYDTAIANLSAKSAVEVDWKPGENDESGVERGHWSFETGVFTANDSLIMTDLWVKDADELDIDTDYINAVRVTVKREETPIPSFFAKIFGRDSFQQEARAVAYIGFTGTFAPGEVNFPIALCEQTVYPTGGSGDPVCTETVFYEKDETAMWTNLEQPNQTPDTDDTCDAANSDELKDIAPDTINSGNQYPLVVDEGMGATNGANTSVMMETIPAWEDKSTNEVVPIGSSRKAVRATVPLVDCSNNTCVTLTGAVEVQILWMIRQKANNSEEEAKAPYYYYDVDKLDSDGNYVGPGELLFSSTEADDAQRMLDFIDELELPTKDEDGKYVDKRTFFKLECEPAIPKGGPGGINSGVHAARAVLVK